MKLRTKRRTGWFAALLFGFALLCTSADLANAETMDILIEGTITVAPNAADRIKPSDRLVIKIHHPDAGIEKDAKYQIVKSFDLPLIFKIAPTLDMSKRTKWNDYIVEVFTDRDGDVTTMVADELYATSDGLVPVGAKNVWLELADPRSE